MNIKLCFPFFIWVFASTLIAQNSTLDPRLRLTHLEEELSLIKRSLGIIELELEGIQAQQKKQQQAINKLIKMETMKKPSSSENLSLNDLKKMTDALRAEALSSRKDILKRIEDLASQAEKSLNLLRKSFLDTRTSKNPPSFNNDYPKQGIEYTVMAGDTLGKISKKFNSKVSWIQNANKITDPKKLNIGKILFIPQE